MIELAEVPQGSTLDSSWFGTGGTIGSKSWSGRTPRSALSFSSSKGSSKRWSGGFVSCTIDDLALRASFLEFPPWNTHILAKAAERLPRVASFTRAAFAEL